MAEGNQTGDFWQGQSNICVIFFQPSNNMCEAPASNSRRRFALNDLHLESEWVKNQDPI
jgi:hypothetical protein